MARFRFRLQAVLDHRAMVEEERQRAVGTLERERVRLEQAIRDAHGAIVREKSEMREDLAAGDVRAARLQSGAVQRFAASAQRAVLELAGVHKRLVRAREELLRAATARKAIELLRDRHQQEWRAAMNRREAADADEMSVMRAGRKDDL